MKTKFNQDMYAKMRAWKNEPFSNLKKRVVWVVKKATPVMPISSVPEATRTASPTTSMENIIPYPKKQHVVDEGKEKADLCLSSVRDDVVLALTKA